MSPTKPHASQGPYKPTLILHGGAGGISRSKLPPSLYAKYHASLLSYLTSTKSLLNNGSSAIEAACHAVCQMEDDPLFNCGRGSVFTTRGEIEMEASLAVCCVDEGVEFEGMVKRSAAVSMVRRTRHPILLAREVLSVADGDGGLGGTGSMHGHLSGWDVESWGFGRGLERMGKKWFWTKRRWDEHRRGLGLDRVESEKEGFERWTCGEEDEDEDVMDELADFVADLELPSQGTVGAVCMDSWGVIAVATSTGGLTNKLPGRIGDTPTVGAGFWAGSWSETIHDDPSQRRSQHSTASDISLSARIALTARSEFDFWLGDCWGSPQASEDEEQDSSEPLMKQHNSAIFKSQPLVLQTLRPCSQAHAARRRAVAMSGTGNGDSFLRINACRTAAAICRFSCSSSSLAKAVSEIAGPGGELQRSAGDRWGKTGQGEGGIIGIELAADKNLEGVTVFDFNCGGLWRAYYENDSNGVERPRIMVFREEY